MKFTLPSVVVLSRILVVTVFSSTLWSFCLLHTALRYRDWRQTNPIGLTSFLWSFPPEMSTFSLCRRRA